MEKISTKEVQDWAKEFLSKSEKEITNDELKEQKKYAILIQNPSDKTLLSKMLDESSQIHNSKKLARRMKLLIEQYGVPRFFNSSDAFLLHLFTSFGYWFDFISVPIFKKRLHSDTSKVIINEKQSFLTQHLMERRKQKIGQNVNLLGEVVLGDGEANHRYLHYLEALKDPQINYISIKISGIYAQINPLNYAQNKIELCERLNRIFQQSIDFPYVDDNGVSRSKFVNLDMEEYKDLELTFDVFKTVLSLPQFKNYTSGIVVQAYLPDAWNLQTELLEFAKKRVAEGGSPIKMRLVKGANLQMESIVSSLKGWENPVLGSKVEVDANYLHILDRALEPKNAKALHIGVASHNFFSIGYAYLLSKKNNVEEEVTFEMLEGMANHLPRVMRKLDKQIILYTPVVKDEHFLNAVSYLVRRLDENTGKDNFLSYSFNLKYNSKQWKFLQQQFTEAYELKDKMKAVPFRTQDRNTEQNVKTKKTEYGTFRNEPDTNFDLKPNRLWADTIRNHWKKSANSIPYQIPVQIGEKELPVEKKYRYFDRSQAEQVCVCEAGLSSLDQVKEVISIAEGDPSNWRKTSLDERTKILYRAADNLGLNRGNLIGCMSAITGKTFYEGDVEVSEAIDFCRFYPFSMKSFMELKTVSISPKGIVLVIPPWNFPLAIPVGGVAAALTGGNTVILKPATTAYPVAREFANAFWDAGVPKDALQVLCTDGREPLTYLTAHPSIKHIILTGGTDTAFQLLANNPTCPLSAETGGKNAIILTSSGDRDHAIQNIVTSAFSNAGQKCSACSLLLLEKDVYNDPDFKIKLTDAVTSMKTGGVWDGGTIVGPMITSENEKLLHAINHLEAGESWLVKPEFVDKKQLILKPCVKWGVRPDSYTFKNELFAPLLGVVCIDDLDDGIKMVNASEYGLTSGLQSLDEREQLLWKNSIEAGNLYINRGITGAIVNRQPFGGMKRSAFGGGIKAGGRNYVTSFVNITGNPKIAATSKEKNPFTTFSSLLNFHESAHFQTAIDSYIKNWKDEFSKERDIHHLMGEQNTFRYLPLKNMALRVQDKDTLCDIFMILAAANIVKTPIKLSINADDSKLEVLKKSTQHECTLVIQNENEFLKELDKYERIRTCNGELSDEFYLKAAKTGKYIASARPLVEGRIELLHYVKEQSIAYEYHRYGSITQKPEEN
ncbi:MAG: bifunctional proline dehydrogenase/L-glutamate gamma-semialdehyde dehydrogenase [Bacteroidota bacterium]|nr:bifunctional proline dehydrogenase/L-glutamate gamma-semialdehyde dehydrogenase [Bacteroidota bacterium]